MSKMIIETAYKEDEVDEAYELASKVFAEQSTINNYDKYKTLIWKQDPTYAPDNFVLARNSRRDLIGIVRIVPRTLYRGHQQFEVAGISSVCLDPSHRGQGLSIPLMESTLEICKQRGFDLALLFARRAADHYYSRFGFWGISSYNKAMIRKPEIPEDAQEIMGIFESREKHVDIYRKAYENCYAHTFGRILRNEKYWVFLLKKLTFTDDLKLLTITKNGTPIGYIVKSQHVIHEIAYTDDLSSKDLINTLNSVIRLASNMSWELEISSDHRMFSNSSDLDVTVSFRECSFGGHMVKILNLENVIHLLVERFQDKINQFKSREYVFKDDGITINWNGRNCFISVQELEGNCYNYNQTCKLLGVYVISIGSIPFIKPLPFNVNSIDQF